MLFVIQGNHFYENTQLFYPYQGLGHCLRGSGKVHTKEASRDSFSEELKSSPLDVVEDDAFVVELVVPRDNPASDGSKEPLLGKSGTTEDPSCPRTSSSAFFVDKDSLPLLF